MMNIKQVMTLDFLEFFRFNFLDKHITKCGGENIPV